MNSIRSLVQKPIALGERSPILRIFGLVILLVVLMGSLAGTTLIYINRTRDSLMEFSEVEVPLMRIATQVQVGHLKQRRILEQGMNATDRPGEGKWQFVKSEISEFQTLGQVITRRIGEGIIIVERARGISGHMAEEYVTINEQLHLMQQQHLRFQKVATDYIFGLDGGAIHHENLGYEEVSRAVDDLDLLVQHIYEEIKELNEDSKVDAEEAANLTAQVIIGISIVETVAAILFGLYVLNLSKIHIARHKKVREHLQIQGAAIEAAANAIVITDRTGTIEWVNTAFTIITGYSLDEVVGNNPRLFKSGTHDEPFYHHLWQTILAGKTWNGELVNCRKDGTRYHEEMTITPVRDERGDINHFIGIKQDITNRKIQEEKLWQREEVLRQNEHKLILQNVELQKLNTTQSTMNNVLEMEIEERKIIEEELEGQASTLIRAKEMLAEQTANLSDQNGELRKLRKSAERAARISTEKEERIRAIVNAASNGIISVNDRGIIESVNPALCRMFCYQDNEILGQNIKMLMPLPLREEHEESLSRFCNGGEGHILGKMVEVAGLTKNNRIFPLELVVNELSFNKRRMFVGVLNDITDRKQVEEAERETLGLQEAVNSMEKVLGVIGHELRTPLAAVRMTSEYLLNSDTGKSEESGPFVKSIHDETVRMAEMVNNMLEVSRMNSGCAQWNWDLVNLATVCGEAINTIRPFVEVEAVELEIEMASDLSMRGDPDAIRRLILNLLSNAAKHTTAGSIVVSARALDDNGEGWIQLEVRDTGEGIPPEIAKKLGEPFALNSGLVGSGHIKGTGLGLAICKGIVAAHGGTLAVESHEGEGSSFMVSLRSDLPEAETVTGSIDIKGRVAA